MGAERFFFSCGARRAGALAALSVLSALPCAALAQSTGGASLPLLVGQSGGSTSYAVPIQTLLFFTALSFLPAVLLLMTGFTRIVIVLSLLRQAIGTQAAPPNQVVIGLSLFLTFFVMGPTIDKVYADAYQPYADSKIDFAEALKRGESPVRSFMMKQTRQADVMLFAKLARIDPAVQTADVPFKVLVELRVAPALLGVRDALSRHRSIRRRRDGSGRGSARMQDAPGQARKARPLPAVPSCAAS